MDEDELRTEKSHFQALAAAGLQLLLDGFEEKTGVKLRDVYVTIIDKNRDVAIPDAATGTTSRAVWVSVRLESPQEYFDQPATEFTQQQPLHANP